MPKPTSNPCAASVKKALQGKEITSDQYQSIVERARNIARTNKRLSAENLSESIKDIKGELSFWKAQEIEKRRRSMLLSAKAVLNLADVIERNATKNGISFGEAAKYYMLGGEGKGARGFGGGLYRKILAAESESKALFATKLKADGLYDYAVRRSDFTDVMTELAAMTDESIPKGSTKNAKAKRVAEIMHEVRERINSEYRLHGGFLDNKLGYMQSQTHDYAKIQNLGRSEGIGSFVEKADKEVAYQKYLENEAVLWDMDAMVKSNAESQEELTRAIFENLWNNERAVGNANPFDPPGHSSGGLANKRTKQRVIIYKSPADFAKHEATLGMHGDDYFSAFMGELASKSKTSILLKEFGPRGKDNLGKLRELLSERSKVADLTPEQYKQNVDSLRKGNDGQWDSVEKSYDTVTGAIDVPESQALARGALAARTLIDSTTSGGFLLGSFSDFVITPIQAIYSGCKALDSVGKMLEWRLSGTRAAADYCDALGCAAEAWITEAVMATRADGFSTPFLRKINKMIYSVNGMNWHTTVQRASIVDMLTAAYGRTSDLVLKELPELQRMMLEKQGYTHLEWEATRKTVTTHESGPMKGRRIITSEVFDKLSKDDLIAIASERGLKPSEANLKRIQVDLRQKWNEFIHDRVAAALTEPGGFEKWATTWGGNAREGTWPGIVMRSIMKFKSFPIAVVRRNIGMWQSLGFQRGMGFGMGMIAGMTIAGYMTMTVRNLLAGKQRPQLFDENGEFNHKVLFMAMERGGALGPYGTMLIGDYERFGHGILDVAAGPMITKTAGLIGVAKDIMPDDEEDQPGKFKLNLWRNIEGNIPMLNMFYIKPAYDHALGWWIRESLRPGTINRAEEKARKRGEQFFVRPSETVGDIGTIGDMFSGMPGRVSGAAEQFVKGFPDAIAGE